MKIDNKQLIKVANGFIASKTGISLFKEDGAIDRDAVCKLWLKVGEKQVPIEKIKETEKIEIKSKNDEDDDIVLNYDENSEMIEMYVPKWLQEQVRFDVAYTFSRFDRIEAQLSDLKKEFAIDRESTIDNAKDELNNFQWDENKQKEYMQHFLRLNSDVGEKLRALKSEIGEVVNKVNEIPQNRMLRLIGRVSVEDVLNSVNIAKRATLYLMKGTGISAEFNMILGKKEAALTRIEDSIAFLSKLRESGDRLDQWYDGEDDFWRSGLIEKIEMLTKQRDTLNAYDGKIMIEMG